MPKWYLLIVSDITLHLTDITDITGQLTDLTLELSDTALQLTAIGLLESENVWTTCAQISFKVVSVLLSQKLPTST